MSVNWNSNMDALTGHVQIRLVSDVKLALIEPKENVFGFRDSLVAKKRRGYLELIHMNQRMEIFLMRTIKTRRSKLDTILPYIVFKKDERKLLNLGYITMNEFIAAESI